MAQLRTFLGLKCIKNNSGFIDLIDFYGKYKKYCNELGVKALSKQDLYCSMINEGYSVVTVKDGFTGRKYKAWKGIEWK